MKSAYEKAMERLERESGPTRKLNDAQKASIADIDRKYDAQVAEQRLAFDARMGSAQTIEERDNIQAELASTLASIESRREKEKAAVWEGSRG